MLFILLFSLFYSVDVCGLILDFDVEKYFLRDDVQRILKQITGFDLNKVFRERKIDDLQPPEYKLLTTKQLKEVHVYHFMLQTTVWNFKYIK